MRTLPLPIGDQEALPALQEYQFSKDSNGEPTLVSRAEYQFAGRMRLAGYGPEEAYGEKTQHRLNALTVASFPRAIQERRSSILCGFPAFCSNKSPYGRFLRNPGMGSMARAKSGSAQCHVSRSVLCDPGRPSPVQFGWMLQKLLHT